MSDRHEHLTEMLNNRPRSQRQPLSFSCTRERKKTGVLYSARRKRERERERESSFLDDDGNERDVKRL